MVKKQTPLNIASVFSGIGAFEQALKQLKIKHNIVFACDNGERDLTFSYDNISQLCQNLTEDQRHIFVESIWKHNRLGKKNITIDMLYSYLFGDRRIKGKLELSFENIILLTQEFTSIEREAFVNNLYEQTGKENHVKSSYLANFDVPSGHWHEDIRFLNGLDYAHQVDILVGGSPCQSFSTYGKKRGLEDTRGTLFYDYARVISEVQPKVFIYENVKNVLNNDYGRTWEVMKDVWDSLGYELYFDILNAQDYGTPQLRQRLFLVGFRKDVIGRNTFEFPPKQRLKHYASEYLEHDVDVKYYLGKKGFEWVTTPSKNLRRSRVNQDIIGCQTANQQDNWIGDFRIEPVQDWQRSNPNIYIGEYAGQEAVARKMTPTECLRLMGFKSFKQVVDDKRMYRQAGNSIVVSVLEALIKKIIPIIDK